MMRPQSDSKSQHSPTFLTLPTEIRLQIYELAYDAQFVGSKLVWKYGFALELRGSIDDRLPGPHLLGSPFSLLRVCRQLHHEVSPLLPPLAETQIKFLSLTEADMKDWLARLTDDQVSQIRHFEITGWDTCYLRRPMYSKGHHADCHMSWNGVCTENCDDVVDDEYITKAKLGLCDRSLTINLTVFERDFNRTSFDRIMNGNHQVQSISGGVVGPPMYDREFYKGYYLLRILDGCVVIPQPYAHPDRQTNQCNSVVDIQQSMAGFVSAHGELTVTKEAITGLQDSVAGDTFQGGSSTRYLLSDRYFRR